MKKLFLIFGLIIVATIASAANQYPLSGTSDFYQFVLGSKGGENGYIQINQDIASFTFVTDFGSIGNAGSLGFYTYTDNPIEATDGGVAFRKSNGMEIDLGKLEEGEKVGFYLTRNNGDVLRDFYFTQEGENLYLKFTKNGGGGDETFLIARITYLSGEGNPTSGQPLPGILAALLMGSGIAIYRRKRIH